MVGAPLHEIEQQVLLGARFVVFESCTSIVLLSLRRSSDIHFILPGTSALSPGLRYTLWTLILGWWGRPWGPIWTIRAVVVNLGGGRDVTQTTMAYLRGDPASDVPVTGRIRCQRCGHDSIDTRRTCNVCRAPLQ